MDRETKILIIKNTVVIVLVIVFFVYVGMKGFIGFAVGIFIGLYLGITDHEVFKTLYFMFKNKEEDYDNFRNIK